MKYSLLFAMVLLAGCSSLPRLAMHPSECRAPTPAEAELTKSVWQN